LTGEHKYLEAGIRCADQLEKHIRPGDATHTPSPFRIDARTGLAIADEQFGGMVVASVRLFDELVRLGEANAAAYKKARDLAWKWLKENPLNKESAAWDKWSGYYEDVPKDTVNENDMDSVMTAYYILSLEDPVSVDPDWLLDVGHLIDRSRELLGRGLFSGAWAIDEQLRPDGGIIGGSSAETAKAPPGGALLRAFGRGCCSRAGLVCRTSQWGAINAMYFEKTHDLQAREDAFRSLNYATYFAESDGKINCCGTDLPHSEGDTHMDEYWFEDGYSDAGRSFIWALGAVPDFAPIGQNHLLRSSSVVQKVNYYHDRIDYRIFSDRSVEVLRVTFKPARMTGTGTPLLEQPGLDGRGIYC
jgi:hypothetical protein